ncbi:hypothetical protein NDU88_000318 [Pleurodeles waltl]|uniref:Uncharacterized protein n=1 Tax=Pleurodeles waltl TaxID=8319 RepID=A0AAV7S9R6_PLEWA|nr:hypothetical protein NDU88_000318 [Pleurodeles waltl]
MGRARSTPGGTSASGFPDPDVVLSVSNQRRHPGAEGGCNTLPDVAQASPGETRTPSVTGTRGDTDGRTRDSGSTGSSSVCKGDGGGTQSRTSGNHRGSGRRRNAQRSRTHRPDSNLPSRHRAEPNNSGFFLALAGMETRV